ncbi:serine/threonine-protein kinase [Polyangium jinanense]|uniref:non-specific serine/threonine protein kinase n=1 Tax=Polyangium jinanense TaxID=2829994 RepID=A0A9X3X9A8_9BACT|nr:serine/threonine-protein kinase [Polyangium jinanense]MDC3958981.1 protein kinase [Polyangium jinanense]MDC3986394.1 protein kinase [Polyangium jinanense]
MQPGELVAHRFLIEGLAGSGGMGSVFRARDLQEGAPAAIKVVRTRGPRDLARFDVEARLLAELHHPGIVRYIAHGFTAAGDPFLAMEWLDGEDLSARLARGRLGVEESVALLLAVAEALAIAHARGVVHRDIKPGNVFLVGRSLDRVRLLDFGIARPGLMSPRLTETGAVLGTPGYMAPEQARGAAEVDARADVFALGAVLFECLTGKPAFVGQHVMAVLAKVMFEDPPLVRELRREVPAMLEAIVACMLAKEPADRPANAAEVAEALASLERREVVPRAPVLTRGEQRVLSIIAVGAEAGSGAPLEDTLVLDAQQKALETAVAPFGARIEHLADGSALAILMSTGSAADQAARAARCALRLAERAPEASIVIVTGLGELEERIPVGQVIDRAAALLGAAPPRGVLLDEVTAQLLDTRFQVTAGPAGLMLSGESDIVEAPRPLLGKPSPCVGRDRELRVLLDLLDESVRESVARVVLVTGPPGIGKSRLRQEFVLEVRRQRPGVDMWIGRADAMSAGSAFALVGSAVRRSAGISGGEPIDERQRKLVDRVARHVAEKDVRRVAEFLGEMTGTPFSDAESVKLRSARQEARIMADQIGLAWETFLAAACRAQSLLLVLEDLHWGDFISVKLVDSALRDLKGRPLLVAAFGRPEVHERFPRLWTERGLSELRLGELTPRAAEELARHALGDAALPQTIARVVERSAGHPFFLEELIRAVAEGRGDALPETVLAMVEARLSALPPEARCVLRAASVFGEVFWRGGVVSLLDPLDEAPRMDEWLALLVEREVVQRSTTSWFPEEEQYSFRHSLLREGAYATLRGADRVLGHRLAAEWLERSRASDAVSLAEHFERGGAPERAVKWYLEAAKQMLAGNDLRGAIAYAEHGLRNGAAGEPRGELLLVLMVARVWSADWAAFDVAANQVLREAMPGDPHWCAAILGKVVMILFLGKPDEVVDALRTVCNVEPSPERVWMMVDLLGNVHGLLLHLGRLDVAALCAARMKQLGNDVAAYDPLIRAKLQRMQSMTLVAEGDFWASLKAAQEAYATFEEAGYRIHALVVRISIAQGYRQLGAHAQAEQALRSVLHAESDAFGIVRMGASQLLAIVLAERGALEEARKLLASLVNAEQVRSTPYYEGRIRWTLSYVFWRLGEHGKAEREARIAIGYLAPTSPMRAAALATLAEALLGLGRAPEALGIAKEAIAVRGGLGAFGLYDAFVHLTYAKALRATGDLARARTVLFEARARLLSQATKIGDPELRKSFLENVPENAEIFALADAT